MKPCNLGVIGPVILPSKQRRRAAFSVRRADGWSNITSCICTATTLSPDKARMASRAVIPRFLLPLQSPLWRSVRVPTAQAVRVRYASSGKTIVLEKPAKFNPPSHGSRLKKNTTPKHYGPTLTKDEIAEQNTRHYPGMMSPQGSWSHWFWHSRLLHTFITMVGAPGLPII